MLPTILLLNLSSETRLGLLEASSSRLHRDAQRLVARRRRQGGGKNWRQNSKAGTGPEEAGGFAAEGKVHRKLDAGHRGQDIGGEGGAEASTRSNCILRLHSVDQTVKKLSFVSIRSFVNKVFYRRAPFVRFIKPLH